MVGRKEIIFAGGGFVLAVILAGAGLWWHDSHKKQPANNSQTVASDGGLSVSGSGGADNLGQLNGTGSSQGSSGNSSSSSGNSSGSGGADTSNFGQYDKYKNNQNALFGDITAGTGAALGSNNKATIYYRGWLTNGTLIDQSPVNAAGQRQPFVFTEGAHQVILGMEEAMYGMKAGGARLLIIPPAVGYGAQGQGSVPPNSVLVFEVQLISVQ